MQSWHVLAPALENVPFGHILRIAATHGERSRRRQSVEEGREGAKSGHAEEGCKWVALRLNSHEDKVLPPLR